METYPFSRSQDAFVDLSSQDAFNEGAPFATFDRLRREDPFAWTDMSDGGKGFWNVVRHADAGTEPAARSPFVGQRHPHGGSVARGIRSAQDLPGNRSAAASRFPRAGFQGLFALDRGGIRRGRSAAS
jgi:hypothetical protein